MEARSAGAVLGWIGASDVPPTSCALGTWPALDGGATGPRTAARLAGGGAIVRHEGRNERPTGASYSPSSGSGSSSGARPAQRGGQGRRRGTGQGGGQGSSPSSGNTGGMGGFFNAIKKRFKG